MNIKHYLAHNVVNDSPVKCPRCHFTSTKKHGSYTRKGFHILKTSHKIPMTIPRYRCLNPDCHICTFSVLPCCVLRYCRFFYPGLLQVKYALSIGIPARRLARFVWNVGDGVMKRAAAEISRMDTWLKQTYRELSDGGAVSGFNAMVKFLTHNLGYVDLTERYSYHRYSRRLEIAK